MPLRPLSHRCLMCSSFQGPEQPVQLTQPFARAFSGETSQAHFWFSQSWAPRPQTTQDCHIQACLCLRPAPLCVPRTRPWTGRAFCPPTPRALRGLRLLLRVPPGARPSQDSTCTTVRGKHAASLARSCAPADPGRSRSAFIWSSAWRYSPSRPPPAFHVSD